MIELRQVRFTYSGIKFGTKNVGCSGNEGRENAIAEGGTCWQTRPAVTCAPPIAIAEALDVRSVTPEVAGQSPLAPEPSLQIGLLCCRFRRQIGADHTDCRSTQPEDDFKAEFARADGDLRKQRATISWPEVTAPANPSLTGEGPAAPAQQRLSFPPRPMLRSSSSVRVGASQNPQPSRSWRR